MGSPLAAPSTGVVWGAHSGPSALKSGLKTLRCGRLAAYRASSMPHFAGSVRLARPRLRRSCENSAPSFLPRRSCLPAPSFLRRQEPRPLPVMLSGAGGGAETSLGERRRTQDARQRESAPPHFHSLTRPDKALGHSCENSGPSFLRRQEPRPLPVMLSGAGGGAETSLGERRRTQDARQRESAPPHLHSLTRPDKALGHSCGGRNLAAPAPGARSGFQPPLE